MNQRPSYSKKLYFVILFFSLFLSNTVFFTSVAGESGVSASITKKNRNAGAGDVSGAVTGNASYNFSVSTLSGATITNPTSIQFGPDNRLYVSQQNGIIKIFTVARKAANSYSVTATETISLINKIPNHNDNGTVNTSVTTRQITGILVVGTASRPVIYVSSSDSRIGGGSTSGDINLDTNSGIISKLNWNGTAWTKVDLVRGLPRSEENHSVNGMQLDPKNNKLYLAVGGITNAGSPSNNFGFTCEYALSGAILSIDLNAINAMPTYSSGNTAYKYNLPTLDDPTRSNNADGTDVNDPFGGNDGLNMAKIVPNGPVQIYSPGYRNPYDIIITSSRRMYTIDNGANQGWGGYPQYEGTGSVTNNYVKGEPGSTTNTPNEAVVNNLDDLEYIGNIDTYIPGSHYGGYPNPVRANPAGAGLYTHDPATFIGWRTSKTGSFPLPADWPAVPKADPRQGDFRMPGVEDSALLTFPSSTNGIAEYTASNFNNALKGSLLACGYNGDIYKISLTTDGKSATNSKGASRLNQDPSFASNFGNNPLDITTQGDNAIFPGTVWVAVYGSNAVKIFEPQDFVTCTGLYNSSDDDGDHYTNADEMDNNTNPCSAASMPADFDHDYISDLNDPDDDNDGVNDKTDRFAIDKQNGLATNLPIKYDLLNNNPGTGFFGLGFTGLMSNNSDYLNLYDNQNLIAGGAVGAFTIVNVNSGDALGTLNTQKEAFQFGVKSNPAAGRFTIKSRTLSPFFNGQTPKNYQSQGIYIGTGDQDNYLKVALNANGGSGGIEVVYENGGVATSTQYSIAGGIPSSSLDLFLSVNPNTGEVQPKYASNGGAVGNLGAPIKVGGALLTTLQGSNTAYATGVIATSRGASPFTATWDYLYITNDAVAATDTGSWTIIAPASGLDSAREENAYVQAGNKFYLMGGRGIKPVQEYNPIKKTWINKAKPPIELNHFQAVTLNGLIYAAGAFKGPFPHEVPVPNVYIYNPAANSWYKGPAIPSARQRGSAGAVVYKNKIYLIGGILDGHWWGWVNWFDEYDPATNTWKVLPNAPRARDHFHAVVINDKIYVAGGRRSSDSTGHLFDLTIPEVDVYDFTTGKWTTLPSTSNIPTQRAGASNVVLGNEVIVIGGESGSQTAAHSETEALNVTTNTWRSLAHLQQGRHGTGAIVNNNGIYTVTGPGKRGGSPLLTSQEAFYFYGPTTPTGDSLKQSLFNVPSSISFGNVPVGYDSVKTVTLSNTGGNQDILITSIAISESGTYFSYNVPYKVPFIVPVGKSVTISVHYKPASTAAQTTSLVIKHSGQTGTTTIALNSGGSSSQSVTSFTLINADSGQPIQTLTSGSTLNLAALPTRNLNIRANTNPATVGSVAFNLSGAQNKVVTESLAPYALFGDNTKGDYYAWTPIAGAYTLKATPYSASKGSGTSGTSLTINFTVIDNAVSSFTLVNADNNADIQKISNGAVLNMATLPTRNLNIRANTSPSKVGSVVFNLSGAQSATVTENLLPYALFGDDMKGDYYAWTPMVGSYTLKATPYTASKGTGTAGTPLTVKFSVTDGATTVNNYKEMGATDITNYSSLIKAYPNPSHNGQYRVLLSEEFQGSLSYSLESVSGTKLTEGKLSLITPSSTLAFDFSQQMKTPGVYYLHLENKKLQTVIKLMRL